MNQPLIIQHVAIAIATKNHNPTLLTFDFLKYSDIVPNDWELARQPIVNNQGSQVVFRNGINLVAQQELLSFIEVIGTKDISEIHIPAIARNYVKALPNVEYQAVGIDIRGYITANQLSGEAEVQKFMNTLLASAPWQEVGNAPVKAAIQLVFSLDRSQFNLSINEGKLYVNEETIPIVLFSGNFSYNIVGNSKQERLQSLQQLIHNWQEDLKVYLEIINNKFLQSVVLLADASESEQIIPQLLITQT
jgi:hypothetical protein